MKTYYLLLPLLVINTINFGCSSNPYGDSYDVADTRKVQTVYYGVVISAKPVNIEGDKGSSAAGTIAGGVAGNKAAQSISKRHGVNLTIKLDSGKVISVVQEVDPNMLFRVDQQVQVNQQGSTARVVPLN
ncbi:MAG: outer membrane lipoprotein SlyB [Moritella dasanensis]|jgi:outer membrane lipoprotein SlyB